MKTAQRGAMTLMSDSKTPPGQKSECDRSSFVSKVNFLALPIFHFDRGEAKPIILSSPELFGTGIVSRRLLVSVGKKEKNGRYVDDRLPGAFDMTVLFCAMDFWDEQGRPASGEVTASLTDFARRLRLSDSGTNYKNLRDSLSRLARVKIESHNAFYSCDEAAFISDTFDILTSLRLATRKKEGRACRLVFGRYIMENLARDFVANIDRHSLLSLETAFAQRIFCLVIFQQQRRKNRGVIDFELLELADLIPIKGRRFASVIKERLSQALEELRQTKLIDHEYLLEKGQWILRLKPMWMAREKLLGASSLDQWETYFRSVYGQSPEALLGVSKANVVELLDRNPRTVEYRSRQYSWVLFVMDVFAHMLSNGYEPRDKAVVLAALLKKDLETLEKRPDFVPVDVLYERKEQKNQLEIALREKEERKKSAEEKSWEIAKSYASKLSKRQLAVFKKRIEEQSPFALGFNENSAAFQATLTAVIKAALERGEELELRE